MGKSCRNCIYRRPLTAGDHGKACMYLHDTGKVRTCSSDKCTVKITAAQANQLKEKGMIINQHFEEAFKK